MAHTETRCAGVGRCTSARVKVAHARQGGCPERTVTKQNWSPENRDEDSRSLRAEVAQLTK